jgi:hypothetical protein
MKNKISTTLTEKQKDFLRAFDGVAGNISIACKKSNIKSRTTFYRWLENKEFKEAVDNVNESFIDLAESQLRSAIAAGNLNAVFFLLKTKGKDRGYVERIEQRVDMNPFEELMRSLPDDENE